MFVPLFAQVKKPPAKAKTPPEKEFVPWEHEIPWEEEPEEKIVEPKEKIPFTFARRFFEIGVDVGIGADNDLVGINEIFKKNINVNMSELAKKSAGDGFNLNLGLLSGVFINFIDLKIGGGIWNIGINGGVDGDIHVNIPESLLQLISKGNDQRVFGGMVNASGGIFADAGLSLSAKYSKLRIGIRPSAFTPVVFVPKSGINYKLETTDDKLELTTGGTLIIYSPIIDYKEDRGVDLNYGTDISAGVEYDVSPKLGIGVSASNIPVTPAEMEKRTIVTMKDFNLLIEGDQLLTEEGKKIEIPEFEYDIEYDTAFQKVYRPLRFDVYAMYRPFGNRLLVKPAIGYTVNLNDKESFFSFGVESQLNLLKNLLLIRASMGYDETVWKHRLGLGINFRAFELDIEGVFRSHSLVGSFMGRGLGVNVGLRFGW